MLNKLNIILLHVKQKIKMLKKYLPKFTMGGRDATYAQKNY